MITRVVGALFWTGFGKNFRDFQLTLSGYREELIKITQAQHIASVNDFQKDAMSHKTHTNGRRAGQSRSKHRFAINNFKLVSLVAVVAN